MKNKKTIIVLIVLLAIGFAAVSTTLVINGAIGLSFGELDIYYSKAVINGVEDNSVIKDKTHIDFDTTLTLVGEKYILDYDVTNGSRNYDAKISMNCDYETEDGEEYLSLNNTINTDDLLEAMTTRTGHLTIKMIKAVTEPKDIHITCEIQAIPKERDKDPGDEIIKEPVTLVETILSKSNDASIQEYASGDKGEVYAFSHDETEQMRANTDYRFIGSTPNNYITFDNETWRIIGVFEDENGVKRAKIMRDKYLEYNLSSQFKWDEQGTTNYASSAMYKKALKRAMSDGALDQTDEVTYYLGGSTAPNQSAESFYNNERSLHNSGIDNFVKVKVGLPYVSDYYYTYAYGISDTCFNNPNSCNGYQYDKEMRSSWFYDGYSTKFMNPLTSGYANFYVKYSQGLNIQSISEYANVKETVYLKADTVSVSGNGSSEEPYVVDTHDSRDTISSLYNSKLNSNDVEKVTFVNAEPKAPENAILSWDVSDAKNGSIMAYTLDENNNDKFELYVAKIGKTYANKNSNSLFSFSNAFAVEGLENFSTKNVEFMYNYFSELSSVISLDLSSLDTSLANNMTSMFSHCRNLISLNVSGWDTSNVTQMRAMFDFCEKLKSIDLSSWNTSSLTEMSGIFEFCYEIEEINLHGWDTSKVTNMQLLFDYCKKLKKLDISTFDTRNVTDMQDMFMYCEELEELDLSHFNTINVTKMNDMFNHCVKLRNVNLSSFNTSNVTAMSAMFSDCSSLTSLDLSNFDTRKVDGMHNMFARCYGLTELDLSNFVTSSLTGTNYMFILCNNLKKLNLSGFVVSKISSHNCMFYGMASDTVINVGNDSIRTWLLGLSTVKDGFNGPDRPTEWDDSNITVEA